LSCLFLEFSAIVVNAAESVMPRLKTDIEFAKINDVA